MARTITDNSVDLQKAVVVYSTSTTIAEIIDEIETLQDLGKKEIEDQSLKEAIAAILRANGERVGDFKKPAEILGFLRGQSKEKTIGEILDSPKLHEVETDFGSKTLNAQDTKLLIEAYEDHLANGDNNKEALDWLIENNKNVKESQVRKLIETRTKLIAAEKNADQILIKAAEIEERTKGEIKTDKAMEIAQEIIESKNPQQDLEDLRGKVSEEAAEAIETVVREVEIEEEIEISRVAVKKRTSEIIDELTKKIIEETDLGVAEVKPSIEKAVNTAINEQFPLTETYLLGNLQQVGVPADTIAVTVLRESENIKSQLINGELGNNLDQIRSKTNGLEVYKGMLDHGATRNEALRAQQFVETNEPSIKDIQLARDGLENVNQSPNNVAANQAAAFNKLLHSKTGIAQDIKTLNGISNRLGINDKVGKNIAQMEQFAKFFEKNPALTRSMQMVQRLLNLRNTMYKAVGFVAEKAGLTFGSETLITFAGNMALKATGSELVAAMATHFVAAKSIEGGMNTILGQLLAKGTVTAVQVGGEVAVEGAAVAGGAGGLTLLGIDLAELTNPIGWVLLAAQLLIMAGMWIWDNGTKAINNFFESININPKAAVAGLGVAAVAGGAMAITWVTGVVSAIPAMLASVVISPWLIAAPLIAMPVYSYAKIAITMASPLVMNMAEGEELPGPNGISVKTVPLPTLDPNVKIPEGCPSGLPVSGATITQGYMAAGCSHLTMKNAIDLGIGAGTPIRVTHNGLARAGSNSTYGNYVDVTGSCGGITFTTRYAHMPRIPFEGVKEVKAGDVIGEVDNTGSSSGNHLHYDIRNGTLPLQFEYYLGLKNSIAGCCIDNGHPCPQD